MAKDERKIVGAVAVHGYTRAFVAGDEDALADAIKKDKDGVIDVAHLSKAGAISGFGESAGPAVGTLNRQRDAEGDFADSDAVEAAAQSAGPAVTTAKTSKAGNARKTASGERARQKKARG